MVALKSALKHPQKVHFSATRTTNSGPTSSFFRPPKSARYLNPQTGLWLSTDPAMGEYVPAAPINDDVRKQNGNLPGMGGVFNVVNLHVYHYAGNNPVKYVDPDGRRIWLSGNRKERNEIVRRINEDSSDQYKVKMVRIKGTMKFVPELVRTGRTNQDGSIDNSNTLNKAIDDQQTIVIISGDTGPLGGPEGAVVENFAATHLGEGYAEFMDMSMYSGETSILVNWVMKMDSEEIMVVSQIAVTLDSYITTDPLTTGTEIAHIIQTFIEPTANELKRVE
jgi:hypothetical protein